MQPAWSPIVWESVARERVRIGREKDTVTAADLIEAGKRFGAAEVRLQKKGLVVPATPVQPKTPYRRYMSDVRRLAGLPTVPAGRKVR